MASTNENPATISSRPRPKHLPHSARLDGPARMMPATFRTRLGGREEVEALRRQVVALQRISSLGVLAGGVFHELNNALTPVLNYAKLGLRNPDPAYRERALTRILEAGQRAAAITGGMLGLSRPGRDPNHREPVDLNRLVEEVVLLSGKDLARNKVRLEVQLLGRPFARVNPAQIQQVLINLLINARQAMPDGGAVTLRLAADPGRTARRAERDRPRRRHRAGEPAAHLRALLLHEDRPRRLGTGRDRPGPGRLPRHRRGPSRPPPRREPPRPGIDVHAGPPHLSPSSEIARHGTA